MGLIRDGLKMKAIIVALLMVVTLQQVMGFHLEYFNRKRAACTQSVVESCVRGITGRTCDEYRRRFACFNGCNRSTTKWASQLYNTVADTLEDLQDRNGQCLDIIP